MVYYSSGITNSHPVAMSITNVPHMIVSAARRVKVGCLSAVALALIWYSLIVAIFNPMGNISAWKDKLIMYIRERAKPNDEELSEVF